MRALEIGGPTSLFGGGPLSLYSHLDSVDGLNLNEENYFQQVGEHFSYQDVILGDQYLGDLLASQDLSAMEGAYDALILSHVIEHFANPIKALANARALLSDEGLVLAILPDRARCFDRNRPLTTMEHIRRDFDQDVSEDDPTHVEEQLALHDWALGGIADFKNLALRNGQTRVVHHHTFDLSLTKQLFSEVGFSDVSVFKASPFHIVYLGRKQSSGSPG